MTNTILHSHPFPSPTNPRLVTVPFHILSDVPLASATLRVNGANIDVEREALDMFGSYKRRRAGSTPRGGPRRTGLQMGGGWFRLAMSIDSETLHRDAHNAVELIVVDDLGREMRDVVDLLPRQFSPESGQRRVVARFASEVAFRRATVGTAAGNADDGWVLNDRPTTATVLERWPDGTCKIVTLVVEELQRGECVIVATSKVGAAHAAGNVTRVELHEPPAGPGGRSKSRKASKPADKPTSKGNRPKLQ